MRFFSKITIAILIVLNIVMYYNFVSYKKKSRILLLEEAMNKYKVEKEKENIRELLFIQYQLNGEYIDSIFINTQKPFEKKSVVLFFSEKHCKSCVKKILQELYFLGEKFEFNNFILAGYYENEAIFNATADSLDYKFKHLFISKAKLNMEMFEYPTVFIVDNNYQIRLLYAYDYYPDIIFTYFRKILPNYLTSIRNNKLKSVTR